MMLPWQHPLPANGSTTTADAPSWQPTPLFRRPVTLIPRRTHAAARTRINYAALLAFALGFFAFLPYPAFSIGSSSALQAGNVLAIVACAPILIASWRRRPYWIVPALIAPLIISSVKVAVTGGDNLDLCLKAVIAWGASAVMLLATQLYAPRYALEMLTGAAIATLLHATLGFYQAYCFTQSVFPFAEWYANPSFLSVQENARNIARYTRRPFGYFPEPSAMAASLSPWLIFWAAEVLGLVRLRREPARWQRILFTAATVGGLALIVISQSGHAAITLAALTLLAGLWLLRSKATLKTYLTLAFVFGIVLPAALYFGAESVGERLGGKSAVGNSSWEERSDSLIIGFNLLVGGDGWTVLFGLGTGLSAPMVFDVSRISAVFSVLLSYVYETGVVGGLVLSGIGLYLARVWRHTRFDVTFASIFVVWLVGVTLTTSYQQLLPIWMTLGWLTVWPSLCCAPPSASEPLSNPGGRRA